MIHRLFETDAFEMLARGIPRDEPIVAVDVGAHTGRVAARIREVFANARVYAFEPAPGPVSVLRRRAERDPGIVPVELALGSVPGETTIYETRNPHYSSLLKPAESAVRETAGSAAVVGRADIHVSRLDDWAARAGVGRIDLMKLDVQGYELEVLRGAGALMESVRAVYAEAHLTPAYEGAASFSEIDLLLRRHGLVVHQVHELMTRGDELQTVQLDALWLRQDLLDAIRRSPLERVTPPWVDLFRRAVDRCARAGHTRIALYGGGTHTRTLEPWLDERGDVRIVTVIDDSPASVGETVAGRPVIGPDRAASFGLDAVILSSDSFEDELWRKSARFRDAGIPVFRLYGRETD